MSLTFTLPDVQPAVPVTLVPDLSKDQLLGFPAFKTWISTLQHSLSLQGKESHVFHSTPYALREIIVQAVDHFGGKRLGFVKLKADISNASGEKLPGSVFLRGGSVCMMLILQPDDVDPHSETDKYVIMTVQPRIPVGSLNFIELPAGMLDDSGTFSGAAAKEIEEETGLKVDAGDLINITELAIQDFSNSLTQDFGEQLQPAMYPSPGGSDEYMPIFLWQKLVMRSQLKEWSGKLTGLRNEGEKITLTLARLKDLWRVGGRDGKTLAAYALYTGLREGGYL